MNLENRNKLKQEVFSEIKREGISRNKILDMSASLDFFKGKKNSKNQKRSLVGEALKELINENKIILENGNYLIREKTSWSDRDYVSICANKISKLFKNSKVEITDGHNDHGIDAIISCKNRIIVIQCKNYKNDKSVTEPLLRDFLGSLYSFSKDVDKQVNGIFCTTTSYSINATEFAKKKQYILDD